MLVYGDRARLLDPTHLLADVAEHLGTAGALHGLDRHDRLTRAFLSAAELAQGLADDELERTGQDDFTPLQEQAMGLATAVARQLYDSWSGGAAAAPLPAEISALQSMSLPPQVRCILPEGHAFYAIYPDAYFAAAAGRGWAGPPLVIGLRTIGAGLAAAVAAATGGRAISLRPVGQPFCRRMQVSDRLAARLQAHGGPFAITDEGPGLSGSSFGAAADLLSEIGADAERIVFMPSHPGAPGPLCSPRRLELWRRAQRQPAALDAVVTADAVSRWFADVTGPVSRVEFLSAGDWRRDLPPAAWPPATPRGERVKLRLTSASGRWLARFVGLGDLGEGKLARAVLLHAHGFAPKPRALRRGFLLETWVQGRPLARSDRAALLAHLGPYLGFRARAFPARESPGADLSSLVRMAAYNAARLCGGSIGRRVEDRLARLPALEGALVPVHVDARLHAWEWVRTEQGFCKTDALDHSCGHDLIGCQDIAWDAAGAAVELGLDDGELAALTAAIAEAAGRPVSLAAARAFRLCYAAFQGGAWSLAEASAEPGEQARIRPLRERYAAALRDLARGATPSPTSC